MDWINRLLRTKDCIEDTRMAAKGMYVQAFVSAPDHTHSQHFLGAMETMGPSPWTQR